GPGFRAVGFTPENSSPVSCRGIDPGAFPGRPGKVNAPTPHRFGPLPVVINVPLPRKGAPRMRHGITTLTCLSLLLAACGRTPQDGPAAGDAAAPATTTPASVAAAVAEVLTAGSVEFPVIPPIMVPGIVGSGPAQKRLEASMQALIDPIAGITVRPANCTTD